MRCKGPTSALALLLLSPLGAWAQEPQVPSPAPPDAPAAEPRPAGTTAGVALPANTVIELEVVDAVSSHSGKPGDFFRLRVLAAIQVDGRVLIPAGTPAMGQIVHAQKAGGGGRGGELILAARYLDLPQGRIELRAGFGASGRPRTGAAAATAVVVGVFGMQVKGKELEVPAGHALSARLAADTTFHPLPDTLQEMPP